jgi:hypothetical protein
LFVLYSLFIKLSVLMLIQNTLLLSKPIGWLFEVVYITVTIKPF